MGSTSPTLHIHIHILGLVATAAYAVALIWLAVLFAPRADPNEVSNIDHRPLHGGHR